MKDVVIRMSPPYLVKELDLFPISNAPIDPKIGGKDFENGSDS